MKINEDFGFSIVSEQELKQHEEFLKQQLDSTILSNKDKLNGIKEMIMPLLKNLMKDPQKHYIFWPNRIEKIESFINRIDEYIEKNS